MKGVHDLGVEICGWHVPLGWQVEVLRPMAVVRHVARENFVVTVPWGLEQVEGLKGKGDWPFDLRVMEGD